MKFDISIHLLKNMCNAFDKENITYAILRNHEHLPENIYSKDVDLLFMPKQLKRAIACAILVAKENGYKIVWTNELDYLTGILFVKENSGCYENIKIDFFNGLKWRGIDFLDASRILEKRENKGPFSVLPADQEVAILIAYDLLYAKRIRPKYYTTIIGTMNVSTNEIKETLSQTMSSKNVDHLIENIQSQEWEIVRKLRKKVIQDLRHKAYAQPFHHIQSLTRHIYTELWGRSGMGVSITFSGPDGAGKSSILEPIFKWLKSVGVVSGEEPQHYLPQEIPPLHKLVKFNKQLSTQDYTKPYSQKSAGRVASCIRLTYYVMAFLAASYIFDRRRKRRNEIIIYDRHYLDTIIDPSRNRLNLPQALVSFCFKIVPSPTASFAIIAEPEMLCQRKGELTLEKARYIVSSYYALREKKRGHAFSLIENNGSLEEGEKIVMALFIEALEQATNKNVAAILRRGGHHAVD